MRKIGLVRYVAKQNEKSIEMGSCEFAECKKTMMICSLLCHNHVRTSLFNFVLAELDSIHF